MCGAPLQECAGAAVVAGSPPLRTRRAATASLGADNLPSIPVTG